MDQIELFRAIVKGKFSLPKWISAEANSLMSGLLTRDPRKRLGSLSGGENDIAKHPFFTDTDFGKIRRMEYPAHYVPSIKNPLDASNFESWTHVNDKLKTKYPKLTREEAKIFDNF
jgi:serine/threonine protein kinase